MSAKTGPPSSKEIEQLTEKNRALGEQVKLLMRTEQSLHRSQNAIDRQFSRIRALGEFALDCTSLHTSDKILERAEELFFETFNLDAVTTVQSHPETGQLMCRRTQRNKPLAVFTIEGTETFDEHLFKTRAPHLKQITGPVAGTWQAAFFDETQHKVSTATALIVPLRPSPDHLHSVLVATKRAESTSSFYREPPSEEHLPFVRLLASHAEGALRNALLTAALKDQSHRLTEANTQLTTSLESLERTQQQLLQAQKMEAIGRLAGGVAHDFNNLLTVILSHARLLQMGLEPGTEESEDVGQILEAGDRAAKITSQLLAFSRKQKPNPKPLDVNSLSKGMARMLERLIGETIHLSLDLEAGLDPIQADRAQFEQIILNLVVNARDAMPAGGTITIETRQGTSGDTQGGHHEGCLALSVSDTGCGMNEQTRSQIFEPFFTTKEVGQGTGMGLAMVYGLVQQNRGSVLVQSAEGQGSRFTLLFPTIQHHLTAIHPKQSSTAHTDFSGSTILLVEDEDSIRGVASRVLQREGFHVLEACNGEEALEVAEHAQVPIDLLLTDVVMPRLGGVKLAEKMRLRRPDIAVIFMSGYTFERLDTRELTKEDLHFIPKPFTPDILSSGVSMALCGPRPSTMVG